MICPRCQEEVKPTLRERIKDWYERNYEDVFEGIGPALYAIVVVTLILTVISQLAIKLGWRV